MQTALTGSTYQLVPSLSLEQLARFPLPSRSSQNEVYREFFTMSHTFEAAVRALEESGRLPRRKDGSYRTWDPYYILRALVAETVIKLPEAGFSAPSPGAPSLPDLAALDETWWTAVEATRAATDALARSRVVREQVADPATQDLREELKHEREVRLHGVRTAVLAEVAHIADHLPPDESFWQHKLRAHASTVLRLKNSGYRRLAEFCSRQLSAGVELAAVRLGRDRRGVRALVGTVPEEYRMPALSAASFSRGTRAYDAARDLIDVELPDYNGAMAPALQLTPVEAHGLVDFLRAAGLEMWYTELTAATWDPELLDEMTQDQQVAASYGRIRTLGALLEEAIFTFAEATGDPTFEEKITAQGTLAPRLEVYVKGPDNKPGPISMAAVHKLSNASKITPPIASKDLATRLDKLGLLEGGTPAAQTAEQVMASLLVVRNLTSHRFPVITEAAGRPDWLREWGGRLSATNRALMWAALLLWALKREYS